MSEIFIYIGCIDKCKCTCFKIFKKSRYFWKTGLLYVEVLFITILETSIVHDYTYLQSITCSEIKDPR